MEVTFGWDLPLLSWFRDSKVEEDERYFELGLMTDAKMERLLLIGRKLAVNGNCLTWDGEDSLVL